MCEGTRNFPIQLLDGKKRTLGDLYDQTPKEFISKVMLEEKVFMTWHYRRYVLLGDGAVTAMHDAVALANLLYSMPTRTLEDITRIFEEYQKERLPAMAKQVPLRPQAAFLKRVEVKGTVLAVKSPSEQKARTVFKKRQQTAASI
ncbi:hypothetical protein BGZ91_004479 [Linnemannia elongata]|nr:hypothetical protein BGZ91_004479 [Linnemannia elongata]KAG0058457.1 hypothetical protein BGZ90_004941 [Linnemannia elongata]